MLRGKRPSVGSSSESGRLTGDPLSNYRLLTSHPRVTLGEEESPSVCSAIAEARNNGNKLRLFADRERGLFDISGKMPLVRSSSQQSESLINMLRGEMLSRVKIKEAL